MAFYMRLQNLPMQACGNDLYNFFKDFEIDSVDFVFGKDNEAHITFKSEEELLKASQLDKQPLCGTPVTLLLAKREATEQSLNQQSASSANDATDHQQTRTKSVVSNSSDRKRRKLFHDPKRQFNPRPEEKHNIRDGVEASRVESDRSTPQPGYVIISNLAFSVTPADLRDYFRGFDIAGKGIVLKLSDNEADSLIAGVKFLTMDDALRAEEMSEPLHGREIDIRFVSERMFKKKLESKSGNEKQELQGTARRDTPDPASYWERDRQHAPPGMLPWYYPTPGPLPPVPSCPPGYPGLSPGAHYAGASVPSFPPPGPLTPVSSFPPGCSGLSIPVLGAHTGNYSSSNVPNNQTSYTSSMPQPAGSPKKTEDVKRHTASQGAQKRSAELHSGKEELEQEFHIRIHNLKKHLRANELWSTLLSLGVPSKVVRVVRSPNGAVLFAYVTCNVMSPIDNVVRATDMSWKVYSQDYMDKELTRVSPQCTITEAYCSMQEHQVPNWQEKIMPSELKSIPMRPPPQAADVPAAQIKDHRDATLTATSANIAPIKKSKTEEFHIRIMNWKNKDAKVLWRRLESLGASPKVVRLVQGPEATNLFAYATCYEKSLIAKLMKDKTLCFATSSQEKMDKEFLLLNPQSVITEAYGPMKQHQVANWQKKKMPHSVQGTPTTRPPQTTHVSPKIFKKTLESKSGNEKLELQRTAQRYHQHGPPRMWPRNYPPTVPRGLFRPAYPGLPVPLPAGARYTGSYYPPPHGPNSQTSHTGSIPKKKQRARKKSVLTIRVNKPPPQAPPQSAFKMKDGSTLNANYSIDKLTDTFKLAGDSDVIKGITKGESSIRFSHLENSSSASISREGCPAHDVQQQPGRQKHSHSASLSREEYPAHDVQQIFQNSMMDAFMSINRKGEKQPQSSSAAFLE